MGSEMCIRDRFNPYTFKSILDTQFTGDVLFSPCMGWNAYQLGFYNSQFKHMVSTDVIPNVVDNANLLHTEYQDWNQKDTFQQLFVEEEKTVDYYLCPSEQLDARHNFVAVSYTHLTLPTNREV